MNINTIKASEFEEQLDECDKAIIKCLRENLDRYISPADIDYWVNRVRDKLILEEIEKTFIVQNW